MSDPKAIAQGFDDLVASAVSARRQYQGSDREAYVGALLFVEDALLSLRALLADPYITATDRDIEELRADAREGRF